MIENQTCTELAHFFKALSEPVRIKILRSLKEQGATSVNELMERTSITQSASSKHLKILYDAGLIKKDKREGKIYYSLTDDSLCQLCDMAMEKLRNKAEQLTALTSYKMERS